MLCFASSIKWAVILHMQSFILHFILLPPCWAEERRYSNERPSNERNYVPSHASHALYCSYRIFYTHGKLTVKSKTIDNKTAYFLQNHSNAWWKFFNVVLHEHATNNILLYLIHFMHIWRKTFILHCIVSFHVKRCRKTIHTKHRLNVEKKSAISLFISVVVAIDAWVTQQQWQWQ